MWALREHFAEVKLNAKKSYECACGRRVKRSKTFSQTLNPFNKTKDGQVKTREDIQRENATKAEMWRKSPPEACTHPA